MDSVLDLDAVDALWCKRYCNGLCLRCEGYVGWSYKSGSSDGTQCRCYKPDTRVSIKGSGETFGTLERGSTPQCGMLKVEKKGHSEYVGKKWNAWECLWHCKEDREGLWEKYYYKEDKTGNSGKCYCFRGQIKEKYTYVFGAVGW